MLLSGLANQAQDLTFRNITSEDGISQSEVYCFLQDSKGYMWIGSLDGLNRYDGYTIETFKMSEEEPNGLIHNTIYSLAEDKFGRIWIGTAEGLNLYDPISQQMFAIPNFFSGKIISIGALLADNRNLWIGTSNGLFRMSLPMKQVNEGRLKNLSDKIKHVDIEINGLPSIYSTIGGILKSSDGKIWLGTWEGLCCFDYNPEREETYLFYDLPDELNKIETINCLVEDRNINIWIGTQSLGIYRYNTSSGKVSVFSKKNVPQFIPENIKTMISDNEGNLMIGSLDDGIVRIQAGHLLDEIPEMQLIKQNDFQPGSLNSNMIRSLYVSKDGIVWIGTIGSGINISSPAENSFSIYRIPPEASSGERNNFIRAIYPENEDIVWLGLHNKGLYKYDAKLERFFQMRPDWFFTVFHILPIDKTHLWLATSDGPVMVKKNDTSIDILHTVNFTEKKDIPAYQASFSTEKCSETVFYASSMSGIARIELKRDYEIETSFYTEDSNPSIPIENVRVLKYDSASNVLWAGSEGYGLNQIFLDENYYPVSIHTYKHIEGDISSLSSDYVRSLYLDSNRTLWIGTYEGLNEAIGAIDNSSYTFRRLKSDDGLPNNMVQSIQEDSHGNLWLGTNGGLSKYRIEENSFFNYKISDGLQSNEFSEHSSFYAKDGRMYFGGINGFNIFDPQQISSSPKFPAVNITGFYLRNQRVKAVNEVNNRILLERSIDYSDSIILRPGENDLRFDFSAMNYSNPLKIIYKYKLEGYNQDWIETDALERYANYTNLPSGKYQFKVKASNSKDLWNENSTTLFIQIQTPYALRWWAFSIYILIFVLGILYFTNYSIIKITTKRRLVLDNEHNQRMHELDTMRTRFFVNISHDLRTPLTLITSPIDTINKNFKLSPELENHIDLISRSAKRLRYLIEQILDIRKVEKGKLNPKYSFVDIINFIRTESEYFDPLLRSKGINLNIESSTPVIEAWIDKDMMGKVIFNLLSNAIKNTRKEEIIIKVTSILKNNNKNLPESLKQEDVIKIEFIDRGIGMSKEKQSKIFERFYQDSSNPGSGYGIGLSHSKDLIDAQNGIIDIDSEEGKGTTFTIYLPVLSHLEKEKFKESFRKSDFEKTEALIVEESTAKNESDDFAENKCILIVEDNPDLSSYLVSSLKSRYKVLAASDGEEGIKTTLQKSPDLIVSDIVMPNMDGYELCQKVKTTEEISHIPVILLTARADDHSKYKGLDTGADEYITKPFDIEYLLLRIKNILNSREHLRNIFQKNLTLEPSAISITSSADEKFLVKLMEKIEAGIPESEYSVDTLEKEMSISHTHFYRKVKSLTGFSGKELLQNMRLKRAVDLLLQNKLRVSEIAYMTGFNDPRYFSKCFKKKYGMTPSEYTYKQNEISS